VFANYRVLLLLPIFILVSCGQSQESNLEEYSAGETWEPKAGSEVLSVMSSSSNGKTSQAYMYAKGSGTISVRATGPNGVYRESTRKESLSKMIGLISRARAGAKYVDKHGPANCGAEDYQVSVYADAGKFEIYSASCRPVEGQFITRELSNASAKELVAWAKAQPIF